MKRFYCIAFAVLLVLCLASCSKKDYASVIPAYATFVASVNLSDVATEAGLKDSPILSFLNIGLKASGLNDELFGAVIDDPSVLGLDFTSPAYVFQTANHSWGLVLRVDDSGQLEDVFKILAQKQIASKLTEKEGLSWSSLLGDINVAFNKESLLILVSQEDGITPMMLKQHMTALFGQEAELSFASTEQMQQLENSKSPIAVYSRMTALPQQMASGLAGFLPKGVRIADVEVSMSASFENGKAILKASMSSQNERVQQLLDDTDKHMHTIKGDFLGAASDRSFAWISMGCEGGWLLDLLKQNEDAKQALFMLERGIDIEQMLRSIDGDVTLVLPAEPSSAGLQNSDFMLLAQVAQTDFLNDVPEWQKSARDYGITIQNKGNQQYLMTTPETRLLWGVEQQNLYLATEGAYGQKAFSQNSTQLAAYKSEIEQSQLFAFLNLQAVPDLKSIPLKAVVLRSEKTGEVELRIEGTRTDKSLLSQLLDALLNFYSFHN